MRTAAGSERKTTGSYYTPDTLVKLVLDSTLDPLLDRAEGAGGEQSQGAIAVGLGHEAILQGLCAARRGSCDRVAAMN